MNITRLKLSNFRNYESESIELSPGLNVITGENAQGKTNLLEAVFFCTFARSHRTASDGRLIRHGAPAFYIGVDLKSGTGTSRIEVKNPSDGPRRLFVNGSQLRRVGDLMGTLNSVMFAPETLNIVKGPPAERRRFIDMALSQLYPAYFFSLQQYNAALKQRNALLKDRKLSLDMDRLLMWDVQLAALGADIMERRARFMEGLSGEAARIHSVISGGERLRLEYVPSVKPDPDAEQAIRGALKAGACEDARRGFTGIGPHRDDIAVIVDETDARCFGSQGQQRTAALSMKLSEIAVALSARGEPPVLLLDDVFSELDSGRRRALLDAAEGCQCLLTCTSLEGLEGKRFTAYDCLRGSIRQRGADTAMPAGKSDL